MSDHTREAILDAARTSVLHFGVRRTTLSDIARGAGVSRMTVYRRYPDVAAVLRDLMTREFGSLMEEVGRRVGAGSARERLVGRVVMSVRELREHPLMRKLLEAEPELLLPYLLGRLGSTQRHALALITKDVEDGHEDGSIRPGDAAAIAHAVLFVTQAFLFSAGTAEKVSEDDLFAEAERLVDSALRPLRDARPS